MVRGLSFRSAFFVSSLIHLFLFTGAGYLNRLYPVQEMGRMARELEVSYSKQVPSERKNIEPVVPPTPTMPKEETIRETSLKREETVKGSEEGRSQIIEHPLVSLPISGTPRDALQQKGTLSEEEIITGLHLSNEEKPLYLAYYQSIREKIRKSAYAHYPHGVQRGQILLTFVLFSDGKLKEIVAKDENPFQNRRLKELSIRSVIDASPFPPFPGGLKRSFVSFRVMITFVGEGRN